MDAANQTPGKDTFTQITVLAEKHRGMLEELRFRHRLNFSETIRRGIEQIWIQHTQGEPTSGVQQG